MSLADSSEIMVVVRRLFECKIRSGEMFHKSAIWDEIANETFKIFRDIEQQPGHKLRDQYFAWLHKGSAVIANQDVIHLAGFRKWTISEIEILWQELEAKPDLSERMKSIWNSVSINGPMERLVQFDKLASEWIKNDKLGATTKYDGYAFELVCQSKRFTADIGPQWQKYVANVDLHVPYLTASSSTLNNPSSLLLSHPEKQIFAGFVFRLGASNQSAIYMYFRKELQFIIQRNGGTVMFATPVEGLKVSLTIWPNEMPMIKHQCHHSSIYNAVKDQMFDFQKHLEAMESQCVTDYTGFPIKLEDSVMSERAVRNFQ